MSSSHPPVPPPAVEEVRDRLYATVAPNAEQIVATARFAVGNGRNTTLDYHTRHRDTLVTQEPNSTNASATTAAHHTAAAQPGHDAQQQTTHDGSDVPAGLGGLQDGVGVRTAPTVFITSSTASSEVTAFPLITVGPVIGLTTDTTTRLLIETNTTMTVQMRLRMIERNVRLTRGNRRLKEQGKANSMLNTTTGIVNSPKPQPTINDHQQHASTTASPSVSASSSAQPSASSAVNGHSQPAASSPADFSRTAVTTTSLSQITAHHPATASSALPQPQHSERGSSGTTIGVETFVGATSTEQQPAPATHPSPIEQQQVERDIDPSLTDGDGPSLYTSSPLSKQVERGGAQSAFSENGSKAPANGRLQLDGESLAESVDDGHVIDKDVECTAHRVSVATFTNLNPDCRYEITFLNIRSRLTSTVTTLLSGWQVSSLTPFDVAFVSCNLLSVTKDLALPESDLWLDLRRRVAEHEVDYVCHIGDQIYGTSTRHDNTRQTSTG